MGDQVNTIHNHPCVPLRSRMPDSTNFEVIRSIELEQAWSMLDVPDSVTYLLKSYA